MTITQPLTLIALSGLAGSGKDAAAGQLADLGWQRRAFADPLRSMAYALDPILDPALYPTPLRLSEAVDALGWDRVKRQYPEARRLLQRLGTDAGRKVLGANIWVNTTLVDLDGMTVVTDCRFPNEAEAVRDLGGIVVRLERPGVKLLLDDDGNAHPTETALAATAYSRTRAHPTVHASSSPMTE